MQERDIQRLKTFLTACLYKSNGSMTKFARKYAIEKYSDFYKFFKTLKQNLKNDQEGFAFGMLKDLIKTYVGKVWREMPGQNPEDKVFNAWSVGLDIVALALDNLKVLQSVLNDLDNQSKNESVLTVTEQKLIKVLKSIR